MTHTNSKKEELREQIHRLIIENRNSLNSSTTAEPFGMVGIADDVMELINSEVLSVLKELERAHSTGLNHMASFEAVGRTLQTLKEKYKC